MPIPGFDELRGAERASARSAAAAAWAIGCAATPRRSASGWSATLPRCQTPLPPPYDACEKEAGDGHLAVAGALPAQRLLGADRLRPPRGAGARLRRRGGDLLRRRDHRPASPLLRARGLRLRAAALPGAARAEDRRARPGGAAGRLGPAGGVRHAAPAAGGPDGQARQARVRAGSAAAGGLPLDDVAAGGARRDRPRRDRLRCRQAPGAVPDRAAAAAARPDGLSLSAAGHRGDDLGQDLPGPARRERRHDRHAPSFCSPITSRRSSCRPSCASTTSSPGSAPPRASTIPATCCAWPNWS